MSISSIVFKKWSGGGGGCKKPSLNRINRLDFPDRTASIRVIAMARITRIVSEHFAGVSI